MKLKFDTDIDKAVAKMSKWGDQGVENAKTQVQKSALAVQSNAKSLAPSKTGRLRGQIRVKMAADGLSGEVVSRSKYSAYVEYNTRAHIIRAKKAKMLKFTSGGKTVFRKQVFHPGTREQPFMRPALEQEEPHFIREMGQIARDLE